MPRRPKDPGDKFSFSDLAIGAAMTKRAVQQLFDADLLPRGGDVSALKRVAAVGAFHVAGVPVMIAGRMAKAILDGFNQYDGEVPSGLINLERALPEAEIDKLGKRSVINDYWRHRAGRRHPEIYRPGEAFSNDALIAIVDRRLFFYGNRLGPMGNTLAGTFDFTFGGWIEGWSRGDDARVVSVFDRIEMPGGFNADEWNAAIGRFETEAQHARENAIGTLVVNVSLAVRTALDRLADYRGIPEVPA